jgi:hypothetical protein
MNPKYELVPLTQLRPPKLSVYEDEAINPIVEPSSPL